MDDHVERYDLRHRDGRWLRVYGHEAPPDVDLDAALPPADPPAVHQRYNALRDTWVTVSPARNTRPHAPSAALAASRCPLCPGGPEVPFPYEAAVFDNRFPSFSSTPPPPPAAPSLPGIGSLADIALGRCEVVLYTSTHDGSLATLTDAELARVIAIWADRSAELWADPAHKVVLVFENRGPEVGATLSHPHGQIYALDRIPPAVAHRTAALAAHRAATGASLSQAVVDADAASDRVLFVDDAFVAAVPYAPDWPFEVHVRARRDGARRLGDLTAEERVSLALALRTVVTAYDTAYAAPMAYMMVVHEAPAGPDGLPVADHRLAVEFLPPHRSAEKLKIRASVETALGVFINDTLPEDSAALLRAVAPAVGASARDAIPRVHLVRAGAASPHP
jgi:UDPglucose--hexose-1-phosphate uridylyltransferase